jgi:hypothetical protein
MENSVCQVKKLNRVRVRNEVATLCIWQSAFTNYFSLALNRNLVPWRWRRQERVET